MRSVSPLVMSDSLWPHGPPGSSVHGILQARILEWIAIPFCRGSSQPRDRTWVSHTADKCLTIWATRANWRLARWKAIKLSAQAGILPDPKATLTVLPGARSTGRQGILSERKMSQVTRRSSQRRALLTESVQLTGEMRREFKRR